jgi:hypothetical protein
MLNQLYIFILSVRTSVGSKHGYVNNYIVDGEDCVGSFRTVTALIVYTGVHTYYLDSQPWHVLASHKNNVCSYQYFTIYFYFTCWNDGQGSCFTTCFLCWQLVSGINTNPIFQNNPHLYHIRKHIYVNEHIRISRRSKWNQGYKIRKCTLKNWWENKGT